MQKSTQFWTNLHGSVNSKPLHLPEHLSGIWQLFVSQGRVFAMTSQPGGVGHRHNQLYLSVFKIRSSFLITDDLPRKMWKTWIGNPALLKRIRALLSIHRLPRLCKCLLCESRTAGGFVVLWICLDNFAGQDIQFRSDCLLLLCNWNV